MADARTSYTLPADLSTLLPVLPLRRGVLLPGAIAPFMVGRASSLAAVRAARQGWLLVAAQRESSGDAEPAQLLPTAVVARILERHPNGDAERVVLQGIARVTLDTFPQTSPHLEARWSAIPQVWPETTEALGIRDAFRDQLAQAEVVLGGPESVQVLSALPPWVMADAAAAGLEGLTPEWHKEILTTHDPVARTERVMVALVRAREVLAARLAVRDRVQNATRDQQREFLLRQQLKAIHEELGEGGDEQDELARLRERLDAAGAPPEVREVTDRELKRLARLSGSSPERSVALDWLEWIADLPWSKHSGVDVDLSALEAALDRSHHGLADVKRQVVEHLAVKKLSGTGRADVLLLVGPPGVGKTSIGQAIAEATQRKLVRVALGGVRDEAELRGHRRTYIGARPGRLVEGLRRAGTQDPVILLDEVDKLGTGTWGDPAAALLEILDPEQNHAFVDRYLEVPFDLSKALFVATANDLSSIPGPLRDRMTIIELPGYALAQKQAIARDHLLATVAKNAGLEADAVEVSDETLRELISGWTREAGVRELQRVLGKLYRSAAVEKARGTWQPPMVVTTERLPELLGRRKFHEEEREITSRPGIARGLAWTPVGGDVLYVEASTFPGRGALVLTGQLGDVMKESARAALTYVLSHAEELGIPHDVMSTHDIHVHVPAGGVPKDGPSAGVTMFTVLASLLSGRPVRDDVAMTGEATLRGRVLPVGGIVSKVLAAHRHGVKRVILPHRNGADLDELPPEVRDALDIVLVDHMEEVLRAALVSDQPAAAAVAA